MKDLFYQSLDEHKKRFSKTVGTAIIGITDIQEQEGES